MLPKIELGYEYNTLIFLGPKVQHKKLSCTSILSILFNKLLWCHFIFIILLFLCVVVISFNWFPLFHCRLAVQPLSSDLLTSFYKAISHGIVSFCELVKMFATLILCSLCLQSRVILMGMPTGWTQGFHKAIDGILVGISTMQSVSSIVGWAGDGFLCGSLRLSIYRSEVRFWDQYILSPAYLLRIPI